MFSSFLEKMSEQQRTALERLLDANASLVEVLSEPEIAGQSKWETQRILKH